ncbi:MAG: hypothetical protein RJQ09_17170 [Cyclobacteriaceae bacterium]
MKKLFSILILALIPLFVSAQKSPPEINYIWIDTFVNIDGEQTRLVSENVVEISCCMKSPKYSRVSKKATQWVKENYDSNYSGEIAFKSLQDEALAMKVISEAQDKASNGDPVKMVSYEFKCK